MPSQPTIYAAAGAYHGDKFRTTVSRVMPREVAEIISQDDLAAGSLIEVADIMHGLSRSLVLPRQQQANRESGVALASPVILGWSLSSNKFSGITEAATKYPNTYRRYLHQRERDEGVIASAVEQAWQDSGLTQQEAPIIGYRSVELDAERVRAEDVDTAQEAGYKQLIKRALEGGDTGKAALSQLRSYVYQLGFETASQAIGRGYGTRMKGSDPDDLTVGNRFSLSSIPRPGTFGKRLLRFWDLRKHYANGIRAALGCDPNHVLCPKDPHIDKPDRPLQNIAEAIAYQELINTGHMQMSDLPKPYV